MKRPRPTRHGRHADRFVPLDAPTRAVHYWRHSTGVCPRHLPGRHARVMTTDTWVPMTWGKPVSIDRRRLFS